MRLGRAQRKGTSIHIPPKHREEFEERKEGMELEVEGNSKKKKKEEEEVEKELNWSASEIEYVSYGGEHHLPLIMGLVDQELSEPYSIFTYRYFVYLWPQLCFMAFHRGKCVGTVVCKMGEHRNTYRGYIAMLVVIKPYRGKGIATQLVTRSIQAMMQSGCEEVTYHIHPFSHFVFVFFNLLFMNE